MTKEEFKKYIQDNKPNNVHEYDFTPFLKSVDSDYSITQLFYALNPSLPNMCAISDIDCDVFLEELYKEFEIPSSQIIRNDELSIIENNFEIQSLRIILSADMIIRIKPESHYINLIYSYKFKREALDYLIGYCKTFPVKEWFEGSMHLLTEENLRICSTIVRRPDLKTLDVEKSYNDDFLPVNEIILERLSRKEDKGIVLLYGCPGSGKTHYIRHLMTQVKKKFLVVSADYAHLLIGKEFITFLLSFKNSVIIIEDAEEAIKTRMSGGGASAVANLLNLCDGLLSDALNIQVVVTVNTDLKNVDPALLRKGRIIAKYEFKKLAQAKAQVLSDSLGFNTKINDDMTLAEIYNQNEMDFQLAPKSKIGFTNSN
jgi:hypothetical protein